MFEVIKGDTKKGITPKEQENMKQNQAGRNQEQVYGKMNELDSGNENSSIGIKIHSGDEINSGLTLCERAPVIWEITLGSSLCVSKR